jgi:type II secretory pathway pseudopilin PulG
MPGIKVRRAGSRQKDSGYMLLVLMLAVAVLTITMLGVARNYRRSILRDREVEMIHRGDQYERAVKRFYKKNGRYPTSIEQLEDNNKIRYLRKRYKDPMSPDGTWQLVHLADIAKLKGLTTATGAQSSNSANFLSNSGGLGNASGAATGVAATTAAGTATNASASAGGTTDPSQVTAVTGGPVSSTGVSGANPADGGVLGGGDVYGVVSKAKTEGIHSFGDKQKYNEWFFIYDPTQDTGKGLLSGPYNPNRFIGSVNSGVGNSNTGSSSTASPNSGAPGTVPTSSTPAPSTPTQPATPQ